MTRKHFEAFARVIAAIEDASKRREQAEFVAQLCAASNTRFNRSRFFEACNVEA